MIASARRAFVPITVVGVLTAISSLLACSRALLVESRGFVGDTARRSEAGVPFFMKSEVYRQHSTYEYRWLDVKLTTAQVIGEDSKKKPITAPPTVNLRRVRRTPEGLAAVRNIQALVAGLEPSGEIEQRMGELERALATLETDNVRTDPESPDTSAMRLVSNSLDRVLVTDYKRIYYLNARSTWFSVGKVSTEIGKDGTLSKTDAESGGGLPELITAAAGAVTAVLPVKELLEKKWDLTTPPGHLGLTESPPIKILATLEVEERGYQYEFVRETPTPPCESDTPYPAVDAGCMKPIPAELNKGAFARSEIGGSPKEKESKKPAISVEGRIELPEADEPEDHEK
jgi:hypothetical protein